MAFSILIPTWNNLAFLECCIGSIRKNSAFAHQILVFVNDGSDGTLAWIRDNDIAHIHSHENVGICQALNALFELAQHDLICYMNDDMFACPGWDTALMAAIERIGHQKFYVSATMVEPIETGNACVLAPFPFGQSPGQFKETELQIALNGVEKPNWNGASWPPSVMHRTLWQAIGGYSLEFSPGLYSDPDVSMKLWNQGVREFVGVGQSRIYHFMSKSTGRAKMNNGKRTFLKKWGVSASWFNKNVLRLGTPYLGPLADVKIRPSLKDTVKWLFG